MPPSREQAVDRIRVDHEYMIELARRIAASCTRGNTTDNCDECPPQQRQICHGNIDELIRTFVEVTQKHNLYESLFMQEGVPLAHRLAHNQAHMDLAEQMKAIRLVFSDDGDCVIAIDGIDAVLRTLLAHIEEYDAKLEEYLLAAA